MKVIGRFFVCIWTIIFFVLAMCGGFILFPIIRYIFIGQFDDPMEVNSDIWYKGKELIENFFNNMHKVFHISHINLNGGFWK